MNEKHHRQRVRVITDPEKYRRHRRRKLLRRVVKIVLLTTALVIGIAVFWFLLHNIAQPLPEE